MFARFQMIAGALIATLVLLFATAAATQADVTVFPTALGSHYLLSAHIWAMGGVASALPQQADGLLPNPAGAALGEKQQVIIGIMNAEAVAALLTDDLPLADASGPQRQFVAASSGRQNADEPHAASSPVSTGPEGPVFADGLFLSLAGRCGAESHSAWGLAAEVAPQSEARFLQLGALRRVTDECSLGFNYRRMLAAGGAVVSTATLGAAYEVDRCTFALDFLTTAGYPQQGKQALLGVEYRLGNGLALRAGSAGGNLTYGLGYRKNGWSVDIARLTATHGKLVFPDTALSSVRDLAMLSVSYSR